MSVDELGCGKREKGRFLFSTMWERGNVRS